MALGILSTSTLPMPMLLDAIRHAETGHLSLQDARNARSRKGAIGPYQFLEKNLNDMGYRMPSNITPAMVRDPAAARALAGQYVTGYSNYHGFTTPLQKLAAYNMGPTAAENWLASGGRIEDLPQETQDYVRRAAVFLNNRKTQETDNMAQPLPSSSIAYGLDPNAYRQSLYNQFAGSNLPQSAIDDIVEREMQIAFPPRENVTPPKRKPRSPEIEAALSSATAAITPSDNSITGQGNNSAILNQGILNANFPNRGSSASMGAADRRAIGLGQPPQPVERITYAENFGLGDMTNPNAPNFGFDRGETQFPIDHSAGVLNPTMVNTQYPMDHSAGVLNPTMVNTQYPMDHSSAIVNPAVPTSQTTPQIFSDRGRSPVTQNRRDMSAMSMVPSPQQIGMNEMLIRMGAAGLGASQQGGLEAMEAIGRTYGEIQDANRATGLAAYQAQMDAMSKGDTSKQAAENAERVSQIDQTLFDMDRALGFLEDDNMSLTGFFDSTFGAAWDNIVGNPEASARLLLKKLRVDDTLLRVAQTKGAISNKEMDLFMSPAPQDNQDEQVWIDWIKDRQIALRAIRRRLSTGETVADRASSAQVDQFAGGMGNTFTPSAEQQQTLQKYGL